MLFQKRDSILNESVLNYQILKLTFFSDLTPTSITSTTRMASICARSAKKNYFARQQNTTRDPDGLPFMTSSAKIKSYTDKTLLEVRVQFKKSIFYVNAIQNLLKTYL